MSRAPRLVRTYLGTYYALMLEYRAEILMWVLVGVLPLIMMGVWVQAAGRGNYGRSPTEFVRYFLAVFIVRQFTIVWVIYEFEMQVVEGRLSAQLLKPVDPVWAFVAMHLSEQITRLPFWLAIVVGFAWLYPQALWMPHAWNLALVAVTIPLAFILRFVLQYCFALLSFWLERASALEQLSFLPYLFLSGFLAPLDLFPRVVRDVAELTPFPYMIYFPARLLVGDPTLNGSAIARGLGVMLFWIVLLLAVNRLLWRRGLRHYSAMGA